MALTVRKIQEMAEAREARLRQTLTTVSTQHALATARLQALDPISERDEHPLARVADSLGMATEAANLHAFVSRSDIESLATLRESLLSERDEYPLARVADSLGIAAEAANLHAYIQSERQFMATIRGPSTNVVSAIREMAGTTAWEAVAESQRQLLATAKELLSPASAASAIRELSGAANFQAFAQSEIEALARQIGAASFAAAQLGTIGSASSMVSEMRGLGAASFAAAQLDIIGPASSAVSQLRQSSQEMIQATFAQAIRYNDSIVRGFEGTIADAIANIAYPSLIEHHLTYLPSRDLRQSIYDPSENHSIVPARPQKAPPQSAGINVAGGNVQIDVGGDVAGRDIYKNTIHQQNYYMLSGNTSLGVEVVITIEYEGQIHTIAWDRPLMCIPRPGDYIDLSMLAQCSPLGQALARLFVVDRVVQKPTHVLETPAMGLRVGGMSISIFVYPYFQALSG